MQLTGFSNIVNASEGYTINTDASLTVKDVVTVYSVENNVDLGRLEPGQTFYYENYDSEKVFVRIGSVLGYLDRSLVTLNENATQSNSNLEYVSSLTLTEETEVYSSETQEKIAILSMQEIDGVFIDDSTFEVLIAGKKGKILVSSKIVLDETTETTDTTEVLPDSESGVVEESNDTTTTEPVQETTVDVSTNTQTESTTITISEVSSTTFTTNDKFFEATSRTAIYEKKDGKLVRVGAVDAGQQYPRIGDTGDWHVIKFGNTTGFVKKVYTIPSDGKAIQNANTFYANSKVIISPKLNIAVYDTSSGVSVQYASLYQGIQYPIISDIGDWLRIDVAGRIGYIREKDVTIPFTLNDKFFEATTRTAIYEKKDGVLIRVGAVDAGQQYPRIGDTGDWHTIKFGNTIGYVKKVFTIPSDGKKIKNANTVYSNSNVSILPKLNIAVYDTSSGVSVQFASLYEGNAYPIINDIGDWLRVDVAGRIGFIRERDVTKAFTSNDKHFEATIRTAIYEKKDGILVKVGAVDQGQHYPRIGDTGSWHVIKFGNTTGYVKKAYTVPSDGKAIKNANTIYTNSKLFINPKLNIAVYDTSSGVSVQFASLYEGITYPIISDIGDWLRVDVAGRIGFIRERDIVFVGLNYSSYNLSFAEALDMQMRVRPQTDKYRNNAAYVSSSSVDVFNGGSITGSSVNLRTSPDLDTSANIYKMVARGTAFILLDNNVTGDSFNGSTTWFKIEYENQILYVHSSLASSSSRIAKTKAVTNIHADVNSTSHIYGTVSQGALLRVVSEGTSWNSIGIGAWRNATSDDTSYFLNPINFKDDDTQKYQFLDLRYFTDIPSAELAQLLNGKGILSGTEDIFRQVASQAKINELYLISHALLETGNGTSPLATGVVYNGKTVYNFFGIHAFDSCPIECGAKKAYDEGWFTVELAIAGGAEFAKNSYIYNGQNTLYSMRWNPAGMAEKGSATHQYATDIGWSNKQVHYYSQFYFGREYNLHFDIPVYK